MAHVFVAIPIHTLRSLTLAAHVLRSNSRSARSGAQAAAQACPENI